jgi:hypothetical protein
MITLPGLEVRRRRHGRAPCRYYASGSMANATCCEGSGFDLWSREAALAVNVLDGSHANSRFRTGKPVAPLVLVVCWYASSGIFRNATCCEGSGFDLWIREATLTVNDYIGSPVNSRFRTGKRHTSASRPVPPRRPSNAKSSGRYCVIRFICLRPLRLLL